MELKVRAAGRLTFSVTALITLPFASTGAKVRTSVPFVRVVVTSPLVVTICSRRFVSIVTLMVSVAANPEW